MALFLTEKEQSFIDRCLSRCAKVLEGMNSRITGFRLLEVKENESNVIEEVLIELNVLELSRDVFKSYKELQENEMQVLAIQDNKITAWIKAS